MKFLLLFLCLSCTVLASLEENRNQWLAFKNKHGKLYKNQQEEKLRFAVFQQNLHEIEEHNRKYETGETTYAKAINQFADLTKEEITSMMKQRSSSRLSHKHVIYKKSFSAEIPESIDWRDKGAVTEVKNQGYCGSCWAFSTVGTLEGFNFVKSNQLVSLSAQQLVDCSSENSGCNGGDEGPALEYVKKYGIEKEEDYPYENGDGTCRYNESLVFLRIKDFVQIESGDEDALLTAVGSLGPISVALDATQLVFYSKGIFTSNSCEKGMTNHAVLAVGYGKDTNTSLDYWIVKNSWGGLWGENGYFRIKRGTNECAIAIDCVYPIL